MGKIINMEASLYDGALEKKYILPEEDMIFVGRNSNSMKLALSKISLPKVDENRDLIRGVSRTHCVIERVEDSFRIKDAESTNGTYVNGKLIDSIKGEILKPGDLISLGNYYKLIFRVGSNGDYDATQEIGEKTEGGL